MTNEQNIWYLITALHYHDIVPPVFHTYWNINYSHLRFHIFKVPDKIKQMLKNVFSGSSKPWPSGSSCNDSWFIQTLFNIAPRLERNYKKRGDLKDLRAWKMFPFSRSDICSVLCDKSALLNNLHQAPIGFSWQGHKAHDEAPMKRYSICGEGGGLQ